MIYSERVGKRIFQQPACTQVFATEKNRWRSVDHHLSFRELKRALSRIDLIRLFRRRPSALD